MGRIRSTGPRTRSWSLSAASRAEIRADSTSWERVKEMGLSSWKVGEGRLLVWREESILMVFVGTDAASFAMYLRCHCKVWFCNVENFKHVFFV